MDRNQNINKLIARLKSLKKTNEEFYLLLYVGDRNKKETTLTQTNFGISSSEIIGVLESTKIDQINKHIESKK